MYLDASGNVDKQRARFSYQSVGVPGTVAGMALALEKYGTMTLAEVLAPAIYLAREGITVTPQMADTFRRRVKRFSKHAATARIFLHPDGTPLAEGERLVQSDLAGSLSQIAEQGPDAFYRGEIAEKIAADMTAHDGLITKDDLENYRAIVRKPVHGTYRDYDIYSMPPPSSGGIHVIQILNILEDYPIAFLGHNTADTTPPSCASGFRFDTRRRASTSSPATRSPTRATRRPTSPSWTAPATSCRTPTPSTSASEPASSPTVPASC
jgi:gamma-glutamyltranspeptidase/glutathione hydrolase